VNRILISLAVINIATISTAAGPFVPIYAGPAYDRSTGDGYLFPGPVQHPVHGVSAGNGFGIGQAFRFEARESQSLVSLRWDTSGNVMELEDLGSDASVWAVNGNGIAVGSAVIFDAGKYMGSRPVRWDAAGAVTELDNLGVDSSGQTQGAAVAINDAGAAGPQV
jgi:hypothetical protein